MGVVFAHNGKVMIKSLKTIHRIIEHDYYAV